MLVNKTIEMCLKNPEKTNEIMKHMAKNRDVGMQTFDQHLIELVKARKISMDDAMLAAEQAEQIERSMTIEEWTSQLTLRTVKETRLGRQ